MKITAVIMAGGKGERFWPKSRTNLPKQFLSLTDDGKTMIQHTIDRLLPLVDIQDIFVVTNKNYVSLVQQQISGLPIENILIEPMGKNTAPCIAFASAVISKKYEDAIMLVLPSDHLIKFNDIYLETLKNAIDIASYENNLVTIGITPSYPETGYGYIHFDKDSNKKNNNKNKNYFKVKKFVEKPNLDKAKEYLASGDYLWNSGMFVWKVSSIMKNFQKFLPNIYDGLIKISDALGRDNFAEILNLNFKNFESISIDYGIMEKAENIFAVPGNFGWDDVGSWLALERINKKDENGNVVLADNFVDIESRNCIIAGAEKLIAVAGLEDIIIVDTTDAILVCNKNYSQKVKDIILKLKNYKKTNFL